MGAASAFDLQQPYMLVCGISAGEHTSWAEQGHMGTATVQSLSLLDARRPCIQLALQVLCVGSLLVKRCWLLRGSRLPGMQHVHAAQRSHLGREVLHVVGEREAGREHAGGALRIPPSQVDGGQRVEDLQAMPATLGLRT